MLKSQLRKQYIHIRNSLDDQTRTQQHQTVLNKLITMPIYRQAKKVAVYKPFKGEFDPTLIIHHALQKDKQCFVPEIVNDTTGLMTFTEITLQEKKIISKKQQIKSTGPIDFDLMLIPLVAFDNHNNRLGMGGGFYDRYLAQYCNKKPYLLGLAYNEQFCEELPIDIWDKQLDRILIAT